MFSLVPQSGADCIAAVGATMHFRGRALVVGLSMIGCQESDGQSKSSLDRSKLGPTCEPTAVVCPEGMACYDFLAHLGPTDRYHCASSTDPCEPLGCVCGWANTIPIRIGGCLSADLLDAGSSPRRQYGQVDVSRLGTTCPCQGKERCVDFRPIGDPAASSAHCVLGEDLCTLVQCTSSLKCSITDLGERVLVQCH